MAIPHSQLASETNLFNTGEVDSMYNRNLPGYGAMRQQQSGVIGQQLQGQVPTDVVNQIIQQAAERGISTGLSGSPNESSALLRALGLSSIGQQQQGMESLDRSINQTPVPELFAPQSLFVPQMLASQEYAYAAAGQARQDALNRSRQVGSHPGLGLPSSVNLSGVGRQPTQFSSPPSWQNSAFNSPMIGGSNNIGGASFWGGSQPVPAASPWSMNQGAGGAWLGGGAQGPTQGGSIYMGSAAGAPGAQPSTFNDQDWEDFYQGF